MKKNKKFIIILVAVILIILLFPIRLQYKDSGTNVYRSIVGIYEVTDWNRIGAGVEYFETRKTGITVKLFGVTVFDNSKTKVVSKHITE